MSSTGTLHVSFMSRQKTLWSIRTPIHVFTWTLIIHFLVPWSLLVFLASKFAAIWYLLSLLPMCFYSQNKYSSPSWYVPSLSPTNQSQELGGETKDCCRSRPHEKVSLHHHLLIITITNKSQWKPPITTICLVILTIMLSHYNHTPSIF